MVGFFSFFSFDVVMNALSSKHRAHSCFACVNVKPVQMSLFVFILRPDTGPHINSDVWEELTLYSTLFCSWDGAIPVYWALCPQLSLSRSQDALAFFGRVSPFSALVCCRGTPNPLFLSLVAGYALVYFQLRCIMQYTISLPGSGQGIICAMPQLPAPSQQLLSILQGCSRDWVLGCCNGEGQVRMTSYNIHTKQACLLSVATNELDRRKFAIMHWLPSAPADQHEALS